MESQYSSEEGNRLLNIIKITFPFQTANNEPELVTGILLYYLPDKHTTLYVHRDSRDIYSFINLEANCGWVVNATPTVVLPPEKRPGTHCAGG